MESNSDAYARQGFACNAVDCSDSGGGWQRSIDCIGRAVFARPHAEPLAPAADASFANGVAAAGRVRLR
jgi:hypothetical protein